VGAGEHHVLRETPYIFSRTLDENGRSDKVLVAMDLRRGYKAIPVFGVFPSGTEVTDAYSGETATVRNDSVALTTAYGLVLLGEGLPPDANDSITVYVTNDYETSMEIYASGSGTQYRMGVVNPGIPSRFVIRRDLLAGNRQIQFFAQASGYGPRARSDVLQLRSGDVAIDFVISPTLIGSRATIRP
jgi:hypothetical protein